MFTLRCYVSINAFALFPLSWLSLSATPCTHTIHVSFLHCRVPFAAQNASYLSGSSMCLCCVQYAICRGPVWIPLTPGKFPDQHSLDCASHIWVARVARHTTNGWGTSSASSGKFLSLAILFCCCGSPSAAPAAARSRFSFFFVCFAPTPWRRISFNYAPRCILIGNQRHKQFQMGKLSF